MSCEYSENVLVRDIAGNLLRYELRWEMSYAYNKEKLGVKRHLWTEKTYQKTVLWRLSKLEKL